MERLAFFLPEGVEPTDEQVLEAMRDQAAYHIDMARDRMKEEHLFDIPAMTSEEIDKRLNNG
jgi:hypothetical protein